MIMMDIYIYIYIYIYLIKFLTSKMVNGKKKYSEDDITLKVINYIFRQEINKVDQ